MGPEANPVKTHWSRVCVYDVCSHDACVNPLDNLWCLHMSCHSAKCHMSFSFAFLSQCLFSAFSYPLLSSFFFLFDLSGVCIVLFYFVILTIPILCISTFSLCFYFCISPPLLCLSMSLLSSWLEGPSLPLWLFLTVECARLQIFVMLIGHSFSGYTGRHHSYI